ncbi:MAG: ABC transporter ATP-binding protein [Promethearchaeota archaeon]
MESPISKSEKTKNIIRVIELLKDFDLGEFIVRAVDNISIDVIKGDFIAIQGPSGAGKTTLLSLIAGLDNPTSGEIYIEGVKVSDFNEESFSTFRLVNIGFIFQNYNLISSLTAEENIIFPLKLAGVKSETEIYKSRVKELLNKVKLPNREEHLPFQLSAGEQQRIGIARALANNPTIILADEPTANLDKQNSEIISKLFNDMNKEGKTIIVVTHDDRIINLAHRVITFEDAKIVKDERVKKTEKIEEI